MGDLFEHERLNTEWKRMDDIEECRRVSGYTNMNCFVLSHYCLICTLLNLWAVQLK